MNSDKLLASGIKALKAGDSASAVVLFSRVVKENPRSSDGWFLLGKSLPEINKKKKIYCFRRVLKIEPDHLEAYKELEILKTSTQKKKVSASDAVTTPYYSEPEENAYQDYYEDEPEIEEKVAPLAPNPLDFMAKTSSEPYVDTYEDPYEKPQKDIPRKRRKKKKKGEKKILALLGIFASLAVLGVIILFVLRPNLLSDMTSALKAPTATHAPIPTATATAVPTATPLPFSALTMGEYTPVFEPADCSFEKPNGTNVDCGFVVVPENRYGDVNKTIRLAVAIYHGSDRSAVPIVYLQGGPGQETVELMSSAFDHSIAPFVGKRDFILLDQRGMGISEPNLDCPKLNKIYEDGSVNSLSTEERGKRYLTAFGECRDRLVAHGVNLSSYNTMENAADVKDVILALGYEKATLFGVSYGTRLAQVVARENPEVVYSVVLDSVLPIDAKLYNESSAIAQASLDTLYSGCAADVDCQLYYPNLEEDLREVVTELQENPLHTRVFGYDENAFSRSVDGVEFMSTILWAMRDPNLQDLIPHAIKRAKAGETNMLGFILSLPSKTINQISLGAYLSINCREQVYASTPKEISDDIASYPDTEAVGLSWVYGDPNLIYDLCDTWQVDGVRPDENDALTGDIPMLVLAGEYDSTTPPFWAEQVSARLSRSTYVEFPGQGHGVAFSQDSTCPQEIVQSFFDDPEAELDISCAAEMPPPEFSIPYEGLEPLTLVPFVSKTAAFKTLGPIEWTKEEADNVFMFTRDATAWDVTLIDIQKVNVDFDTAMGIIVDSYLGVGFDSYPVEVGQLRTENGQEWKLYKTTVVSLPVDIAYIRDGYNTIFVVLVTHSDEHDILYDEVFLKVLAETSSLPSSR